MHHSNSIFELGQVLGVDAALLTKVRPFVTVHSGLQGIDPSKASPELLAIVTGAASFGGATANSPSAVFGAARLAPELTAVSMQRVFSIRSQATGEQGATFAREMVVRVVPTRSRLYSVLVWRQGNALAGTQGLELGAC